MNELAQTNNTWRKCSACKKSILLKSKFMFCPISTCKKSVYCSMQCFDAHVPVFNHKNPWAEERAAPSKLDIITEIKKTETTTMENELNLEDTLVIASKMKNYIRAKSGMNTSASVLKRLSDIIREHCDKAIENAKRDGRKTVMDRDF